MTDKKRRTFSIIPDPNGLDLGPLRKLLLRHGWTEVELDTVPTYVDLMWVSSSIKIPKKIHSVKCAIKNILDDSKSAVTNKCQLYFNMLEQFPDITEKHFPHTTRLHDLKKLPRNSVYIVRPCGRTFFTGKGIYIAHNDHELENIKKIYSKEVIKKTRMAPILRDFDVIASKYITNPLLYNSRKFHLRMYLLITLFPSYKAILWHRGEVMHAFDEYHPNDYSNGRIHDTHCKSTARATFFPRDLLNYDTKKIWDQMNDISKSVGIVLQPHAHPYSESTTAFEVFGVDFMVDDNLNVFMIEINDKAGYDPCGTARREDVASHENDYIQWIFQNAILPIITSAQ